MPASACAATHGSDLLGINHFLFTCGSEQTDVACSHTKLCTCSQYAKKARSNLVEHGQVNRHSLSDVFRRFAASSAHGLNVLDFLKHVSGQV